MPAATATKEVNKEAIRMLIAEIGFNETANKTGINHWTLRKWAERGHWFDVKPNHSQAVQTVQVSAAQVHADELAEHERESRLSLARSARRMTKDAEQARLRDSPYVHKAAQVAGIAFRWDNQASDAKAFTLNVLNLGELDVTVRSTADTHNEQSAQGHSIEDAT